LSCLAKYECSRGIPPFTLAKIKAIVLASTDRATT
jgi:hypothetical protein